MGRTIKHVKITHAESARQQAGAETIGPGVWVDRAGNLHFSVPDLMAFVGLPDTPENRKAAIERMKKIIAEHGIKYQVQELIPDA